ncbi:TRAP transporter substrate-binding protein [Oceaniglobus ichthyenteri]|uniref:TRAP transporter substrate-binding protein n=1 Tax=Oceaniglobus ichthyenteri TaxID=2136177 RepID=UPI0013DDF598|nr:TRAP transporter substrate-binding protein [Oceaniglobus ichthyenteri]
MNVSLKLTAATALVVAQIIGLSAASAQTYNMKIAHLLPPGDPRDLGAQKVGELLEADERCDIAVQVFPSGQLGGFTEINEGVQFGSIEMSVQPAAYMAPINITSAILDFPFFWPTDTDKLLALHQGPAAAMLAESFDKYGLVMLDIWHTGFMQWTSNEPLNTLAAYEGKLARVMPSELMTERQILLGLSPTTMPFSETYSALQNGSIGAQENPIPTTYNMKFHEVQDYVTMTSHGTLDQYVTVNKAWWEKLTDECRTAIDEAVTAGNKVSFDETARQEKEYIELIRQGGVEVVEVSEDERAAMRDATLPGIKKWYLERTGDEGQAILDAFEAEMQ